MRTIKINKNKKTVIFKSALVTSLDCSGRQQFCFVTVASLSDIVILISGCNRNLLL